MAKDSQKKVRVTLKRSVIGCNVKQRACVQGLGLRRINDEKTLNATSAVMGMVNKVKFLLAVEVV